MAIGRDPLCLSGGRELVLVLNLLLDFSGASQSLTLRHWDNAVTASPKPSTLLKRFPWVSPLGNGSILHDASLIFCDSQLSVPDHRSIGHC